MGMTNTAMDTLLDLQNFKKEAVDSFCNIAVFFENKDIKQSDAKSDDNDFIAAVRAAGKKRRRPVLILEFEEQLECLKSINRKIREARDIILKDLALSPTTRAFDEFSEPQTNVNHIRISTKAAVSSRTRDKGSLLRTASNLLRNAKQAGNQELAAALQRDIDWLEADDEELFVLRSMTSTRVEARIEYANGQIDHRNVNSLGLFIFDPLKRCKIEIDDAVQDSQGCILDPYEVAGLQPVKLSLPLSGPIFRYSQVLAHRQQTGEP